MEAGKGWIALGPPSRKGLEHSAQRLWMEQFLPKPQGGFGGRRLCHLLFLTQESAQQLCFWLFDTWSFHKRWRGMGVGKGTLNAR